MELFTVVYPTKGGRTWTKTEVAESIEPTLEVLLYSQVVFRRPGPAPVWCGTEKLKQVCLAQLGLLGASVNTYGGVGNGREASRGSAQRASASAEGKGMPS